MGILNSCKPILKCDCLSKNEEELVNNPTEVVEVNNNENKNENSLKNKFKIANIKHSTDLTDNPYLEKINLSPIRELNKKNNYIEEGNIEKNKRIITKNKNNQMLNFVQEEENKNNKSENETLESLEENNLDEIYDFSWKNIDILSLIPETKLLTNDMNIIIHFGYLNKFLLTTSLNVEKYCLLSKSNFCMYKSKETVLRKQRPFLMMNLREIYKCDIIELDFLKKKNLDGYFFFYILKKNLSFQIPQMNNLNEDICNKYDYENNYEVYNLLCFKKNILDQILGTNELIILYSENEDECDKWVCLINYFINYYKQKSK